MKSTADPADMLSQGPFGERGPFGESDAARADTLDEYISIRGASPEFFTNRSLHYRVIIGKKGAGKTLFLRRLEQALVNDANPWLIKYEPNKLRSSIVAELTRESRAQFVSLSSRGFRVDPRRASKEFWSYLWERALFLSIFNMIYPEIVERRLTNFIESSAELKKFTKLFSLTKSPISALLSLASTWEYNNKKIRRGLDDPRWNDLGELVSEASKHLPPIAVIIDGLDDHFDTAPDSWVDCQHGLFRAIFDLLSRPDRFGNRVHIIASIREVVFSSLLHSEHASRHLTSSYISYITWSEDGALELFSRKLAKRLGREAEHPSRRTLERHIEEWLGFSRLTNLVSGRVEDVSSYILRHTRLLPRDIVIMGNTIDHEIKTRKGQGRQFSQGKLRQTVSRVAESIAREALFSCANEYISSYDYAAETLSLEEINSLSEAESGDVEAVFNTMKRSLETSMMELIELVGKRFFSISELADCIGASDFGSPTSKGEADEFYSITNIMYRHGLILYQVSEGGKYRWKSCWREPPYTDRSLLPEDALLYQFHPILSDVVPSLIRQ